MPLAKSGAETPIDDSAAPIRQPNGELQGVVLVFRDFTEHKQAEKRLHELSLVPAQNPAPILRVSHSHTLLYANPAALRTLPDWRLAIGSPAPAQVSSLATEALNANLCDAGWQAYRTDQIVYFYYLVREFLNELENRWKESRKLPDSADVAQIFAKSAALMEQARKQKEEKERSRIKSVGGVGGASVPRTS